METLASIYAWFLTPLMAAAEGDRSVSLLTVLIVLGIIALIVWICVMIFRHRGTP